jgi:hypothetical protein
MEFDITKINNYVSLCNFNDKRQGRATLIDRKQVNTWGHIFRGKLEYKHIYHLSIGFVHNSVMKEYQSIYRDFLIPEFDKDAKILTKLFEVSKGKMSLCGGSILHEMLRQDGMPNDYDFFFHCDSVIEADDLLKLCMKTIADYYEGNEEVIIKYSRSQGAQTVAIVKDVNPLSTIKIQFIRRNYQYKDQILLGFDLPCCQYGFNLVDGFFTTIPGGMAFALGIFPLDLTQRSLSFGFRLRKYIDKGFAILLPGIKDLKNKYTTLKTPDGRITGVNDKRLYLQSNDYNSVYWNSETVGDQVKISDYDGQPQNNWYYISQDKKHNVTFSTDNWEELYNMPEDKIKSTLQHGYFENKHINPDVIRLKHATLFLGDKIVDYVMALAQNKKKLCTDIWKAKIKDYEVKAIEIYKEMEQMTFRHINPGSQSFGKNNPIITNPREWYGENYEPVIVGISNDRIIALHSCFTNYPKDMLNLICSWWLIAEITDAKNCLFQFKAKINPVMPLFFEQDDERNFPSSSDDY